MSRTKTAQPPQRLSGWGRFPVQSCYLSQPANLSRLRQLITHGAPDGVIARGLGRSYGDAALNADGCVLQPTALDCFRAFDSESGILDCEAGVSLAAIVSTCLPKGWFLPVTPGTRFVTVGGAIAADVHGKNSHRDGGFGNFVLDLRLCQANGEIVTCSSEQHGDLLRATVGGMGLTGVIVSARLQLIPVETGYCRVHYQRTKDLDQTLERLDATDEQYHYSVAWLDGMARGSSLGRSVVMLGNHACRDELPLRLNGARGWAQTAEDVGALSIPCSLPNWTLNGASIRTLNTAYYARHRDGERYVDYGRFFYPLDGVQHWNRVLGRRGFVQYQALFPRESARAGLAELMHQVAESRQLVTLAVLKSTGESRAGLLSFLMPGYTIALDFPNTGKSLRRLTRELDQVLLRHGGRLYLAKDALTDAETFAAMYPNLAEFRKLKSDVDPECRFVSSQARRLGLVESV